MYSEFKTSTNSVLVKRATFAIVKNDNAIDGKIVHIYLKSEPNGTPYVIGKRLNLAPKYSCNVAATTKDGTDTPSTHNIVHK